MRALVLAAAAAAAAVPFAARPAAAQAPIQTSPRVAVAPVRATPAIAAAAGRAAAAVVPVAHYRIGNAGAAFPTWISIADSAGHLVATYRIPGDAVARPMLVAVEGANLVLCAETAVGPLTIVLEGQNDASARGRTFTGRWQRGEAEGQLVGRVKH